MTASQTVWSVPAVDSTKSPAPVQQAASVLTLWMVKDSGLTAGREVWEADSTKYLALDQQAASVLTL